MIKSTGKVAMSGLTADSTLASGSMENSMESEDIFCHQAKTEWADGKTGRGSHGNTVALSRALMLQYPLHQARDNTQSTKVRIYIDLFEEFE